jgi:acetylornithine deacetylase/succinyl-diaminopimelate desuccinylase-like protein
MHTLIYQGASQLVERIEFSSDNLNEAIRLFQGLIRIDTTNPPGNEGRAAEYLKTWFEKEGIDCEVLGEPGRENAVACVKGRREKPRVLFLSHTDVVPATDVEVWSHPPFSAEIEDNWIYGRGANDDKFDSAVGAMSLILLKRQNAKQNGTVLYASVADEEIGGSGAEWLTKRVPQKVASEYVVGEGGGPPVHVGSQRIYPITVGEKGLAWFKLTGRGKGGHGSVPTLCDNASVTMAKAFVNLSGLKTKVRIIDQVAGSIKAVVTGFLGEDEGFKMLEAYLNEQGINTLLDAIASKDKQIAEELRSVTRMTISPNVIRGGTETNVIPSVSEGKVDIRLMPGQNLDYAMQAVKEALRGLAVDLVTLEYSEPSISPSNTEFYDAIHTTLKEMAPSCSTFPQLSTGMSDSRFWRSLGSVVYGCAPTSPDVSLADVHPGIHGPNERMNIESLQFATRFLCNLALRLS